MAGIKRSKSKSAENARKAPRKAALTSKVLRESSARATKAASKRAFKVSPTLLSVKNGDLVRVDKSGKVVEVIKKLELPKP